MNKELPIVLHNLAVGYSKKGVHLSQVHRLLLLVALKSYLYCLDTLSIWSDFVRKKGALILLTRV